MQRWVLISLIHIRYLLGVAILLSPVFAPLVAPTQAIPQVASRFDQISNPLASETSTHRFGFTYTDLLTPVGSVSFEFCSNSPIPDVPCVAPSGLDVSSAVLASQTGEMGFAINGAESTANRIVLTRAAQTPSPVTAESTYQFDQITNPDTPGTHYVRIQTFATTNATGLAHEDGGVAFAIVPSFSVSAEVPPYLKFCSSVIIEAYDCDTATSFFIDMGEFDVTEPKFASSEFVVATNSGSGFSVSIAGRTLTSGNNVIPALDAPSASVPGTSQFGLNLRSNTNPGIGSNPVGPGVASPTSEYNIPNQFKFEEGDIVVSGPGTTDNRKFTASYVTNVSTGQEPGIYATTVSFIALANF